MYNAMKKDDPRIVICLLVF